MSKATITHPDAAVSPEADTQEQQHTARVAWLRAWIWLDLLPGPGSVLTREEGTVLEWAAYRMKALGLYPAGMITKDVAADIRACVGAIRAGHG